MTDALAQPYPERIAMLQRKLDITRQQCMDADHMLRLRDTECRRLRSEASELMAKEADQTLLIADLRQRLDWHTQNAEKQATRIRELVTMLDERLGTPCEQIRHEQEAGELREVIREQGAEIERLAETLRAVMTGARVPEGMIAKVVGQHDPEIS